MNQPFIIQILIFFYKSSSTLPNEWFASDLYKNKSSIFTVLWISQDAFKTWLNIQR